MQTLPSRGVPIRVVWPDEDPTERAMHTAYDVLETFAEARYAATGDPNRLYQLRQRLAVLIVLFTDEAGKAGDAHDAAC